MPEYAVAITFPQNSTTYEALSKLPAATGGFEIRSAAIVERERTATSTFRSVVTQRPVPGPWASRSASRQIATRSR